MAQGLKVTPPEKTVKVVFAHHSCGDNWLKAGNGGLGDALGRANYFVRDTYYKWNALENEDIGSHTDIGDWHTWFADESAQGNGRARRDNIMQSVYETDNRHAEYSAISDPGGENAVIMFKSCYPNSNVRGDNGTRPEDLFGRNCSSEAHTLENCKEVYRRILPYMKSRRDKMFVAVTAPPLVAAATDESRGANARTLNNWLVNEWLVDADWADRNVFVFDLFNVLTHAGNHHRCVDGGVEHVTEHGGDFSAYGATETDSHPNAEGNRKATEEFVPLLSAWYHTWREQKTSG